MNSSERDEPEDPHRCQASATPKNPPEGGIPPKYLEKILKSRNSEKGFFRSQLEPISTPQLRRRLERTFGVLTDVETVGREVSAPTTLACTPCTLTVLSPLLPALSPVLPALSLYSPHSHYMSIRCALTMSLRSW